MTVLAWVSTVGAVIVAALWLRRHLLARAAQQDDARIRAFLDALPQPVFEIALDGRFRYINKTALMAAGYSPGDFDDGGLNVFEVIDPADHERLRENMRKLASGLAGTGHEYRILRKDRSMFYGLVFSSACFVGSQLAGYRGVLIDVSRLKSVESELRWRGARTSRMNTALATLAQNPDLYSGDLSMALTIITETAGYALVVSRAGIWFLGNGDRVIQCHDQYDLESEEHAHGAELSETEAPSYFRALDLGMAMAVEDVHLDPRTRELSEKYWTPGDLGACLDVPILVGGRVRGVLCLEFRGGRRVWTAEEQSFAMAVAGFTAMAVEAVERRRVEKQLELRSAELAETNDKLRALVASQMVSIDLARGVLRLIDSAPPRHTALPGGLELFVCHRSQSCHAAGGDHYFVRNTVRSDGSGPVTLISLKDQSGHDVGCVLRCIIVDLIHHAVIGDPAVPTLEAVVRESMARLEASHLFAADDFFTAIEIEIDHLNLSLQFVSLGHPPLLLLRGDRVSRWPEPQGAGANLPYGFIGGRPLSVGRLELQVGDRLLIYSDGLLDALHRGAGVDGDITHLLAVVEKILAGHPGIGVDEVVRRIWEEAGLHLGCPVDGQVTDDAAVMGIEIEAVSFREDAMGPRTDDEQYAIFTGLCQRLEAEWQAHGFVDNPERLRYAFEEAWVNAWRHGNRTDPGRQIVVRRHYGNDAVLEIEDQGAGFDWRRVRAPIQGAAIGAPSGRGLFMIRLMADEVAWNERGNRISMCFSRVAPPTLIGRSDCTSSLQLWPDR